MKKVRVKRLKTVKKLLKMDSSAQQRKFDYLSSLNDDCIFEILKLISLDDLCAVSVTCKRLHELAADHFSRKYSELSSKPIIIEEENGVIDFCRIENYQKCFAPQSITVRYSEMNAKFWKFMRSNCGPKIKKIIFNGLYWTKLFDEEIKFTLQHVEIIALMLWKKTNIRLDDVLKHLPLVKNVKIDGFDVVDLPHTICPQLEVFDCRINHPSMADALKNFFLQNTTVKRFTCRIRRPNSDLIKKLLKNVIHTKIEELFLAFHTADEIDFTLIRNELKMLDARESFKRLELETNSMKNLFELASLKTFKGFHLCTWQFNRTSERVSEINSFIHLTILMIGSLTVNVFNENLLYNLPNLMELYYFGGVICMYVPSEMIVPFVRYAPKLIKFVVNFDEAFGHLCLERLNAERSQLKHASNLVIYLKPSITTENYTNNCLVRVKYITTSFSEDPDLTNPLIPYKFSLFSN